MRKRIEQWLYPIWYGDQPAPKWLELLSRLYQWLFNLHRKWGKNRRPEDLSNKKIIVVGNLTTGGSGKTPLVIRLCEVFTKAGLKPGVVSRGYGRKRKGLISVHPGSAAHEVGDEPLVIFHRAAVPVVVASDRCEAARQLFDQGIDVVIADDGLQHHLLPRTLEICVIDGERVFGNGKLLPAGPLREPRQRLESVDRVVINGSEPLAELVVDADLMKLIPGLLHSLNGNETWRLSQFAGCRVSAVAGIGNPERFFLSLKNAGMQVSSYEFPDHHDYRIEDFADFEAGIPIIMTEKDAVKCKSLDLQNAWFLAIEASLPSAWEAGILQSIIEENPQISPAR